MSNNGKIFISHAVDDAKYVKLVEDLLVDFCGIKRRNIFRSSGKYNGITPGENFRKFMKDEISKCSLVLSLVTPLYKEREFCQMEVGGVWVLDKPCIPIVTEGSLFSYTNHVFGEIQAHNISDPKVLFALRDAIGSYVDIDKPSDGESQELASSFNRKMKRVDKYLGDTTWVSKNDHDALKSKYESLSEKLDATLEEFEELETDYDLLRSTKSSDIKDLPPRTGASKNFVADLESRIEEVKINTPSKMIGAVAVDLAMQYLGHKSSIIYDEYRDGFDTAIARKYMSGEDGTPIESQREMRGWLNAVDGLKSFLDNQDQPISELEDIHNLDLDISAQQFWQDTVGFGGIDMSRSIN